MRTALTHSKINTDHSSFKLASMDNIKHLPHYTNHDPRNYSQICQPLSTTTSIKNGAARTNLQAPSSISTASINTISYYLHQENKHGQIGSIDHPHVTRRNTAHRRMPHKRVKRRGGVCVLQVRRCMNQGLAWAFCEQLLAGRVLAWAISK